MRLNYVLFNVSITEDLGTRLVSAKFVPKHALRWPKNIEYSVAKDFFDFVENDEKSLEP